MASAIDLSMKPGLAVTDPTIADPATQKALLTLWTLLLTNTDILNSSTQIAKTPTDVASISAQAVASPTDINYINMANVYQELTPLTAPQVDSLFNLARSNPHFTAMAATYWNQGQQMLNYSIPRYCLGMPTVLALNS